MTISPRPASPAKTSDNHRADAPGREPLLRPTLLRLLGILVSVLSMNLLVVQPLLSRQEHLEAELRAMRKGLAPVLKLSKNSDERRPTAQSSTQNHQSVTSVGVHSFSSASIPSRFHSRPFVDSTVPPFRQEPMQGDSRSHREIRSGITVQPLVMATAPGRDWSIAILPLSGAAEGSPAQAISNEN